MDRAGPGTGVDAALREAGLSPQPALVPAEEVPEMPGCVVLTYADDLRGRATRAGAGPREPARGAAAANVASGLAVIDAQSCGGGVAYSTAAQAALRELSPVQLE